MSQTSRLHIDNPGESITRTISLGPLFSQSYLRCSRDGCSETFSASQVDKWGSVQAKTSNNAHYLHYLELITKSAYPHLISAAASPPAKPNSKPEPDKT
ncbi:Protein of unknown function [Pyronema omphalodes CBS 100304]|uniref:Uncharacterized protein n=1 Tax=Pyronema omphalodes (strain CBS 100304) TaxID=1076935 RepID=U4LNC7_PYROM|nr:Protein of unknown function [Pyronema omphalodes CBS 100304]